MAQAKPCAWRALIGITIGSGSRRVRVEAGGTTTAIPAASIPWLRRSGAIEPADTAEEVK